MNHIVLLRAWLPSALALACVFAVVAPASAEPISLECTSNAGNMLVRIDYATATISFPDNVVANLSVTPDKLSWETSKDSQGAYSDGTLDRNTGDLDITYTFWGQIFQQTGPRSGRYYNGWKSSHGLYTCKKAEQRF